MLRKVTGTNEGFAELAYIKAIGGREGAGSGLKKVQMNTIPANQHQLLHVVNHDRMGGSQYISADVHSPRRLQSMLREAISKLPRLM